MKTYMGGAARRLGRVLCWVALWTACWQTTPAAAQITGLPATPVPLDDLSGFRPAAENWTVAGGVLADRHVAHAVAVRPGTGVLVNRPTEAARDPLFTTWEHGDLELELDFMMPKGSNAGLYLQGRYEVQLFDSWGVTRPRYSDVGGLYERWDARRPEGQQGYEGHPPRLNAARAPGLWQHLRVVFQAPRFDDQGRKTAHARFVTVELNGVPIHQNVDVTGPTRAAAFTDEQPWGPLMIQGDHGPVALRDIRYKRYGPERVQLSDVHYRYYTGAFEALPDVAALTPAAAGPVDGFRHDVLPGPDQFAVVYEGRVQVPVSGRYRFDLELDWVTGDPHFEGAAIGGGALRIGGAGAERVVLVHPGLARAASGGVDLEAGTHPFTLTYFKNRSWHGPAVWLYAEGPGVARHVLNAPGSLPEPAFADPILVDPAGAPVLLRSMAVHGEGRRTHAVSVGDPAGVHYTLDLAQGALLYVWKGPFVDATPMWHSRGQDQLAIPRGSVVMLAGRPALAHLDDPAAPWPTVAAADYRFLGYDLDDAGRPTFRYRLGDVQVADRLVPSDEGRALRRTLTLTAPPGRRDVWVQVAEGEAMARLPDGAYGVDSLRYYVALEEGAAARLQVRRQGDRYELLLPVRFEAGRAAVSYTLLW